jgi:hypothetical protein
LLSARELEKKPRPRRMNLNEARGGRRSMGAPCCQRAGWPAKSSSSHNSLLGPPLALPNAIFPSHPSKPSPESLVTRAERTAFCLRHCTNTDPQYSWLKIRYLVIIQPLFHCSTTITTYRSFFLGHLTRVETGCWLRLGLAQRQPPVEAPAPAARR